MNALNTSSNKRWIIIGSGQDPRVQGFQSALHDFGYPAAKTISFSDNWENDLSELLTSDTFLRIESPADDLNTVNALSKLGTGAAEDAGFDVYTPSQLDDCKPESGEFIAPHQFYYGLKQRLNELQDLLKEYPIAASMNHIPDVLKFYDKQVCHQYLSEYEIPMPRAIYDVSGYEDLREKMHATKLRNVFIKTRFGSGASGIIALKTAGQKVHALTTVETSKERLYNTRKLSVIHNDEQVKTLVDKLCQWGVHCEAWIPKATVDQHQCDCRLLVVDGEANFAVLRKSKTPITNLHLLNQRADISELSSQLSETDWQAVINTAKQLATIFPHSFHMALDIAIQSNKRDHRLLEINAFGDFIQKIEYQGMSSYQWELSRFTHKFNKASE